MKFEQLLNNFDMKKCDNKDIEKLTDVESVKRSVRNLINLNHYEKPFHPEIGSNLRAMLFELLTPQMTHVISKQITLLIENYEPRCRLTQVNTMANQYFGMHMRIPRVPRVPRKWCHEVLLGAPLPHAPGVRMT